MRKLRNYLSKFIFREKKASLLSKEDIKFSQKLSKVVGYSIRNLHLYKEAFSLKYPNNKTSKTYERLEFLGDAVLGSIMSSYLFLHYPKANEGYMTQLKSKIVNRKNLNQLGDELGLPQFVKKGKNMALGENISGNLLEALVGAIFLDTNYEFCEKIVLERILTPNRINRLENKVGSYKSLLLEWSQKEKKILSYDTIEEHNASDKTFVFRCNVFLDELKITNASASSKKKAEEKAAQRAFYMLNKKMHIERKA